jgi:hypothetical protein
MGHGWGVGQATRRTSNKAIQRRWPAAGEMRRSEQEIVAIRPWLKGNDAACSRSIVSQLALLAQYGRFLSRAVL